MKPDGKQVQEISTPVQAQLEFKPNRPDQSHRVLDTSHLRIVYGDHSYIDTFTGWNVSTRTDKPPVNKRRPLRPIPGAMKWSPSSFRIQAILPLSTRKGNFRYQEGTRKASSKQAHLDQKQNLITLTDHAKVQDDTGSATGDLIVMNQANGDMDATGHVLSPHAPDKNEKPGTSMLDPAQTMQAKADKMQTRENNTQVVYQGHVVMWQGANRILADKIDINRDEQSLHAAGNVVSELVRQQINQWRPGLQEGSRRGQRQDAAAYPNVRSGLYRRQSSRSRLSRRYSPGPLYWRRNAHSQSHGNHLRSHDRVSYT